MEEQEIRTRNARRLFAAMGTVLLGVAFWIALTGEVTIHGKRQVTTYTGVQALEWAGLTACLGISLFGPYLRKSWLIATWMTCWMLTGIAAVLGPAFL
jgi:hypothetical protein